ncbi:MAG: polysaccharide biosynthesis protein [Bacteroidetes bacterium]|nr:MAG: polysaccharide biosynthesis protein [Bacteroidota bacterium]PIE88624.1 MAG: polysaccharide biosynthesis protein [Bacteroidota bacterium]
MGETAIYGLSSIVGKLLNWLLVPLYVRVLIPEDYGIVTNLYAYVAFLLVLLTYGMETGFFRFSQKTQNPTHVFGTTTKLVFTTSLLFMGGVSLFLSPITHAMGYEGMERYVLILAIIVALDAFSAIPFARLRQQNRPLRFAFIKLTGIAINITLNLFFLVLCRQQYLSGSSGLLANLYNPEIGVGYIFGVNLVSTVVTLLLLLPEIFSAGKTRFDKKLVRQMLRYAWPLLVVGIAGQINQNLDKLILPYLLPKSVNALAKTGIYGANYKLAILMTMFIQAFRYAFEPFFFSRNKDSADSKQLYASIMNYFVIFGLLIFLGVMFYLDLIKFFIEERYFEGLKIVPIVLLANLFLGIFYNLSLWYKLEDKTRYGARLALLGSSITLIINILFVPQYGYMASAWAALICYSTMTVVSYLWGRKYYPLPYNLRRIGLYTLLAGVLFFISQQHGITILWQKLTIHTLLLLLFMGFVARIEGLSKLLPKATPLSENKGEIKENRKN